MRKAILTFLIFLNIFLFAVNTEEIFRQYEIYLNSWEYAQAEKYLLERYKDTPDLRIQILDRLNYLYELWGHPQKWDVLISNILKEGNVPLVIVTHILIRTKKENIQTLMNIVNYFIDNTLYIHQNQIYLVKEIIDKYDETGEILAKIDKLIKDQKVNSSVRLSYMFFIPEAQRSRYFRFFKKEDPFFKGYLLTHYHNTGEAREYDKIFSEIKRENVNVKSIYANFLFSIKKYEDVIDLLLSEAARANNFSIFKLILDSYLILQKYDEAADFVLRKEMAPYRDSLISALEYYFISEKFYYNVVRKAIDAKIGMNCIYISKYAYFADNEDLLYEALDHCYSNMRAFQNVFSVYFQRAERTDYLKKIAAYLLQKEDVREQDLVTLLNLIEGFREKMGTEIFYIVDKLNEANPAYRNMYIFYGFLNRKRDLNMEDLDHSNKDKYFRYMKGIDDLKKGLYGNIPRDFIYPELYHIDRWLLQKNIEKEDVLKHAKNNHTFLYTSVLRYIYVNYENIDIRKIRQILKNYVSVRFLNQVAASVDDEIDIFFMLLYYHMNGKNEDLIRVYDEKRSSLNMLSAVCEDLYLKAKRDE